METFPKKGNLRVSPHKPASSCGLCNLANAMQGVFGGEMENCNREGLKNTYIYI